MSDYNGWTNYETWNVKLWIDNDPGDYEYWREAAREAQWDPTENQFMERDRRVVMTLADRLKHEHEENTPTATGVYADLLNAALSEVNWHEIAKSILEEIEEEEVTA